MRISSPAFKCRFFFFISIAHFFPPRTHTHATTNTYARTRANKIKAKYGMYNNKPQCLRVPRICAIVHGNTIRDTDRSHSPDVSPEAKNDIN